MPDTQYARCGDLSLAYQVFGSGPVNIVVSGSFVTNVEVLWTSPEYKAFFDHLASFARVLIFDKAGVGMSDPIAKVRTVEERVTEIEVLMDTVGFEHAALLGFSEGGADSILAGRLATKPERVSRPRDHRVDGDQSGAGREGLGGRGGPRIWPRSSSTSATCSATHTRRPNSKWPACSTSDAQVPGLLGHGRGHEPVLCPP